MSKTKPTTIDFRDRLYRIMFTNPEPTVKMDEILSLFEKHCLAIIGEDDYPEDSDQNVNYRRTDRNQHRDELRAEQREALKRVLR